MIPFVIFTGVLKTLNPYLRKNILLSLDPHDYLFLNTFIIFIFSMMYLIYKIFFEKHDIVKMFVKYKSLTLTQIIFALLIGIVTIFSSLVISNLDKYYNTPLINSMILKLLSAILLLLSGVFLFNEKYNYKQIIGLVLAIVGGILLFCKD